RGFPWAARVLPFRVADREAPTEGAREAPTEGAREAPTEGAREAPTEGAREAPTEGLASGADCPVLLRVRSVPFSGRVRKKHFRFEWEKWAESISIRGIG